MTDSNDKDTVAKTHKALKTAVKAALERKRKLGQYSVTWENNQIVVRGDDAPKRN